MRLPHSLIQSPTFQFENSEDLIEALKSDRRNESEIAEVERLSTLGLPPITSETALATMIGINPGLVWSMLKKKRRYYREFQIPKRGGGGSRTLLAPRVALKIVQKWISFHLQERLELHDHVFGFVPNKSHIKAAAVHLGAQWVWSTDIVDFFPSTKEARVQESLMALGYNEASAILIADLCTLNGSLPQGSPASPSLSNLAFRKCDLELARIASKHGARVTRYADDIVFSGTIDFDPRIEESVVGVLGGTAWSLSREKTHLAQAPNRLKVHGLLVHGEKLRLTKGYRNKIRAFKHLLERDKVSKDDVARVKGHLGYANHVNNL
jgi:RNA-directed DNA polymerase